MPIAEELTPKVLTTVLVRCWSDSDNDVLVEIKSYSVYQAADDARNEYPGYAYYDPVRVLPGAGDLVEAGADETRAVYFRDDLARNRQPTPQAIDLRPGYRHWHPA